MKILDRLEERANEYLYERELKRLKKEKYFFDSYEKFLKDTQEMGYQMKVYKKDYEIWNKHLEQEAMKTQFRFNYKKILKVIMEELNDMGRN